VTDEAPYVQAATITAAAGDEDALAAVFATVIGPSRAEPGMVTYELSRSDEDPRRFFFYEVYVDRAAAKAHNQTEHIARLAALEEIRRAEFSIVKYRRVPE
jgi:quinol monooxygenase YgiN